MSRDEALRRAEAWAELGALRGMLVLILLFAVIIVLLVYRLCLYALIVAALIVLAIYVMIKSSQYAKVYREERARVATEREQKPTKHPHNKQMITCHEEVAVC